MKEETMTLTVLQSRNYVGIGLKQVGDICTLESKVAKQFIDQGFMKEHKQRGKEKPSAKKTRTKEV